MISPGTYDITIFQNATFSLPLQFKDGAGAAMNMTGYTLKAEVWAEGKRQKLAVMTPSWTSQSTGQAVLTIPAATTAGMIDGFWDLLVTNPDGSKDRWLAGAVTVDQGYTS